MPRSGLPEPQGFDPYHCIELHNKIVRACAAQNPDVVLIRGYFNFWSQQLPEARSHLENMRYEFDDEEFCIFLDGVDIPKPDDKDRISFTPEVLGLCQPREMWSSHGSLIPDTWFVILYRAQEWENGRGLVFDLATRSATFVDMVHEPILPPSWSSDSGNRLWLSLEEILTEWWNRIETGKYVPVARDSPVQLNCGRRPVGWMVSQYRARDLEATLYAWNEYVDTILRHMSAQSSLPSSKHSIDVSESSTLSSISLLNTHRIRGFLRSFLLTAGKPPPALQFIAPGLRVPDSRYLRRTLPEIHARQLSEDGTETPEETRACVVPSILFPLSMDDGGPSLTHGICLCPDENKAWEDSIALTLPQDTAGFSNRVKLPFGHRQANTMFQQGRCPYGYDHCTRLELVLKKWTLLIERGVWEVGEHGVEGGKDWLEQRSHREVVERESLDIEGECCV